VPVDEYLRPQRRFAHLFKKGHEDRERIAAIQRMADANIKRFGLLDDGPAKGALP
jgi:pyruvate ferredoxin oxidoreductase beta subunit